MPQFEISTFSSQLFWFFICWGILFVYLWKFLVPRMSAKLFEREHKIKSILAEASNFEVQSEALLSKYDEELSNFKQVQKTRLQQVSAFVQKSKEDLELDLKKDLEGAVHKLESRLRASQTEMLIEMPAHLKAVLNEFAKKQLPFKVDDESSIQAMLEQEIKKLVHHD